MVLYNVSIAGVCVVEFGTYCTTLQNYDHNFGDVCCYIST